MSYGNLLNGPDKWSSCSNEDFEEWFRNSGHECLKDKDEGNRVGAFNFKGISPGS